MQSSTVQRERLVSPVHLVLMVLLFSVAFAVLKPERAPGEDLLVSPDDAAETVDQLQLAYLKALALDDEHGVGGDDLPRVVQSLLRAGRMQEVTTLLQDFPHLHLSDALRFELDMEFAAREAIDDLPGVLKALRESPKAHSNYLLSRATELSKLLQNPAASHAMYQAWGRYLQQDAESDRLLTSHSTAAQIYVDCGEYLRGTDQRQLAAACYRDALKADPESDIRFEAQLALLNLSAVGSEEHHSLVGALTREYPTGEEQLERLASTLLGVERPDLAHGVYARLADVDPELAVQWLADASRWANAAGKPGQAAQYLLQSANLAAGEQRYALQQRAAALLIQAGRYEYAMAQLEQLIGEQPDNISLLSQGVSLARELGEADAALAWNTRILGLDSANAERIADQVELALMAANMPEAYRWARMAVAQSPADRAVRFQLAQVSEWAGYPEQSLEHWQWLSDAESTLDREDREAALNHVVRLAKITLQPAEGAQALSELARMRLPSDAQVRQLVEFFKLEGRPDAAVAALREIGDRYSPWPYLLTIEADLAYFHSEYDKALEVWQRYSTLFGDTVEALLAQTELLWRLNQQDEAARLAARLQGRSLIAQASSYQLTVLAEIAWRYRLPWLALLVQPRLSEIEAEDQRKVYEQRLLIALQEAGDDEAAIRESVKLWDTTGQNEFALQAMSLAVKIDYEPVQARFTPEGMDADSSLQADPHYWILVANIKLRNGERQAARRAYEQALNLEPGNLGAISSLLWLAIGEEDDTQLNNTLNRYAELAEQAPELWQPMAVGYLQVGRARTSLIWFDKVLEQIEADYGMLLTYADALEYAGRASDARAVRQYALQQLRPILLDGSEDEQSLLLRQFARLSLRYGDTDDNERLIGYLLEQGDSVEEDNLNADDALWREDIAISWLMATQQFEPAKVIMAQMHARRLHTPSWQRLALALQDKDTVALQELIQASGGLSIGNHILALRQLGRSSDAYAMATHALRSGMSGEDRLVIQEQYASLRADYPGFLASSLNTQRRGRLDVTDRGVAIRYSLPGSSLGLGLYATQRKFQGKALPTAVDHAQDHFRFSLFHANGHRKAGFHIGVNTNEAGERLFAGASFSHRLLKGNAELSAEFAYAEEANNSAELLLAGSQHRATLAFSRQFPRGKFISLRADATQINTRIDQNKVALGFGSSVEVGVQGTIGVHNWSTGLRASQVARDRVSTLPDELALFADSRLDNIIDDEEQSLSLGASFSRGHTQADFPQVSSPRYYVNASLGQSWPSGKVGLEMGAGAGVRVLGGDELSFSLLHDTKPVQRNASDSTSIGVHYRYHFQ